MDVWEPQNIGPGTAAGPRAGRYAELEGRAAGLTPHFERDFQTRLYAEGDAWISLTTLDDHFHRMRVALEIAPDGSIVDAAAIMDRHPFDTCPRAVESLSALVGINLHAPGASAATKQRVPRREGCLHLLDMLHVAYRCFWVAKGKALPYERETGRQRIIELLPMIRDTCVSFAVKR